MKTYWISLYLEISSQDNLKKYGEKAVPIIKSYGGKPVVLKAGDTIFIKEGLVHQGISSTVPRICLSFEVQKSVPSHEVTYFFG